MRGMSSRVDVPKLSELRNIWSRPVGIALLSSSLPAEGDVLNREDFALPLLDSGKARVVERRMQEATLPAINIHEAFILEGI